MIFLEVVANHLQLALAPAQIPAHVAQQFGLITGPAPPHCIALDVLIQELIGVKFRRLAGQEEESDLPPVFLKPGLHRPRPVHRMPIDDQMRPAASALPPPARPRRDTSGRRPGA